MKIYLASNYTRRLEMVERGRELEAAGHTITSSWIDGHHDVPGREIDNGVSYTAEDQEIRGWALEDVADLNKADCIIHFTGESGRARGGRHTEFGMALSVGKRCIVVGPRENVFHYLHVVEHYPHWEAARETLITNRYAYPEPHH